MRYPAIAALGALLCGCAAMSDHGRDAAPVRSAPAAFPETLVLTGGAALMNRPTAGGTALRLLDEGAELRPMAFARNVAGFWVYARTDDGFAGWMRMKNLKGRGALPSEASLVAAESRSPGPAYCLRGTAGPSPALYSPPGRTLAAP
jgi:hypothetical protein